MTEKKKVAYGMWPSPISPTVTAQRTRLQDVQWSQDGTTLVWLEGRSAKGVLVASTQQEAPRDLTSAQSVRSGVGYGGGDFRVGQDHVYFASAKDGRLYRQPLQYGQPQAITPGFGASAAPAVSPDGQRLLFVHSYENIDSIGMCNLQEAGWPHQLVQGADFYMAPCWHPFANTIAWIEWDHPQMPWDGTRLMLGTFAPNERTLQSKELLAGDTNTAISQPCFSPDGRYLSYITTHNDLEAMVLYDLQAETKTILVQDTILSAPAWVQGIRTYGWAHDSSAIYYRTNQKGQACLWHTTLDKKQSAIDIAPYTWFDQLAVSPVDDRIALIASSSKVPTRLLCFQQERQRVIQRSMAETLPPEAHPAPTPLQWKAPDKSDIHGLYYPPTHPHFWDDGLPPAIINIHGGPTAQSIMSYAPEISFFTSRGFAVLAVNYRGSTGYGKSYRDALKQNWGVYDVEDAIGAAHALSTQGLADPKRIVLKGGSAGGYTVLQTLTRHPGVFKAGVCLFGISNLFTLAASTHKFEARYLDSLIGPLPDASALYQERSPLFFADQIRDPIAVYQGSEDRVVPPDQSDAIVKALRNNGVPHTYELFEGEGHGWRKTETIEAYYKSVLQFLQQYVLF